MKKPETDMNVELAWMGAWDQEALVFNGLKCKTDEAMASFVGVGEGEGVGAGAILDKLTNCYIFEVGVNVKFMEPRLTAAGVGANHRKRI